MSSDRLFLGTSSCAIHRSSGTGAAAISRSGISSAHTGSV